MFVFLFHGKVIWDALTMFSFYLSPLSLLCTHGEIVGISSQLLYFIHILSIFFFVPFVEVFLLGLDDIAGIQIEVMITVIKNIEERKIS